MEEKTNLGTNCIIEEGLEAPGAANAAPQPNFHLFFFKSWWELLSWGINIYMYNKLSFLFQVDLYCFCLSGFKSEIHTIRIFTLMKFLSLSVHCKQVRKSQIRSLWKSLGRVNFGSKKFGPNTIFNDKVPQWWFIFTEELPQPISQRVSEFC